jgi:hypothetical protein
MYVSLIAPIHTALLERRCNTEYGLATDADTYLLLLPGGAVTLDRILHRHS